MDEAPNGLVRAWLIKALNDLKSARIVAESADGPLDTAIDHCQPAAEKAVKAFLLFHGVTPAKTHDVRRLAVQASGFDPDLNEFIPFAAALTPYAWEFRYPDDLAETYPTRDEFGEALQHAERIYDVVSRKPPAEAQP